jgi:hypothetical protein
VAASPASWPSLLRRVSVTVLVLAAAWPGPVAAKARSSVAIATLDADAVVLVARPAGQRATFEVMRPYLGPLAAGARLPIAWPGYFDRAAAGGRVADRFVLVLHRGDSPRSLLEGGWTVDTSASRPIAAGWAYSSLLFPGPTPSARDEQAEVERQIRRGLAWREAFTRVRAEPRMEQKLVLLRPLFDLPAPDFDGHYDLLNVMYRALREVEPGGGPPAVAWLRDLLTLPHFQPGYGIADWKNFGDIGRLILSDTLSRLQASAAAGP